MLSKPANANCKVFNLIRPWFKGKASTLTIRFKGKASTLTIRFKGKASTLTIRLEGKGQHSNHYTIDAVFNSIVI
jgi:hypothetical protein